MKITSTAKMSPAESTAFLRAFGSSGSREVSIHVKDSERIWEREKESTCKTITKIEKQAMPMMNKTNFFLKASANTIKLIKKKRQRNRNMG